MKREATTTMRTDSEIILRLVDQFVDEHCGDWPGVEYVIRFTIIMPMLLVAAVFFLAWELWWINEEMKTEEAARQRENERVTFARLDTADTVVFHIHSAQPQPHHDGRGLPRPGDPYPYPEYFSVDFSQSFPPGEASADEG